MSLRSSGILLHPTALPSPFGIGDLGPAAFRFADFLAQTGQRRWQMLPLNPTDSGSGHSPYHSPSTFAGNPLLISPEGLVQQGLLQPSETTPPFTGVPSRIDFNGVERLKYRMLTKACERFDGHIDTADYQRFCRQAAWLDDYALYRVLRDGPLPYAWTRWPAPLRNRQPQALQEARRTYRKRIQWHKQLQYLFFHQWRALKRYCHQRQIRLIGDMPIYVPLDSADVWAYPQGFKLTRSRRAVAISGVPPDYFSATGQLWGHPVYDWEALRAADYAWWIDRMAHHLQLYDITRIDHFRGLVAYWEVPAPARTAIHGQWVPVPVDDLFNRLIKRLGPLPVIAEDLGTITADVRETIRRYGFPGMRVLLFAFGDDFPNSTFLPHRHEPNCVVYTGTHDNNTIRGWFEEEADRKARTHLFTYLGRAVPLDELHWEVIRLAMMSTAATAIIPLQDVLGLGAEARMNQPAIENGNWLWRFPEKAIDSMLIARLAEMTETYGRR